MSNPQEMIAGPHLEEAYKELTKKLLTELEVKYALTMPEVIAITCKAAGRLIGTLPTEVHNSMENIAITNLMAGVADMKTGRFAEFGNFLRNQPQPNARRIIT